MRKVSVSRISSNKIRQVHHHSSKTSKRLNNIIHVTIYSPNSTRSAYKKSIDHLNSSRSILTSAENHEQYHHSLSKAVERHDRSPIRTIDEWSADKGVTKDFHRKKKKKNKCTRRRIIIGFVLALLILLIIIMIILLVILLRPKSTQPSSFPSTAILRWNTTGITIAGVTGISGNASNLLNTPRGITLDYLYTLYIADFLNGRVQKYVKDASNGTTVAGSGLGTSSPNLLHGPSNLLVDTNRNFFVSDATYNNVQFWSNGAISGSIVAGNVSGVSGNATNLLYAPYGVAYNSNTGTLYVADGNNNRIMSFALGSLSGVIVASGNGAGLNNTQLNTPETCHFDSPSNSLIIVNSGANNVVRWVLGDNHWTLLAGNINGAAGNTSILLESPRDLTLDPMDNLYVVDKNNHRIQFFFNGQSTGTTIAGVTGVSGNNSTLLNTPKSVALDKQLNLYVSDANNHRIQKFPRY